MIRTIRYVVLIALLAAAAVWLADQPGAVSLQWRGYQIDTSFGVMAIGVGAVAVVAAILYRAWLFIRRAPGTVATSWRGHRRGRGYQALTKGMVAVAAGDADEARRQARKADGLLSEPPLTMLLSAQAAQLSGDDRAAERFFRAMTENRETEFLGLRGLLNQAMKRQDTDEAVALARRAHRLKPDSEWVSQSLFELQTQSGQWLDASVTVKEAARNRHLTSPESRHRQAVLACQMSVVAENDGDTVEAIKQAKVALDLDNGFLPAALLLADHYLRAGKARKAGALIERMWGLEPHPTLVPIYWDARGATVALDRVKASERLAGFNPGHVESDLAIAIAALEADLWGQARKHLETAGGKEPPARICRLMSDLEEAEHGDSAKARHWLIRASMADPDPAWVCGACGHTVETWSATCGSCHAFDTYAWRMPPHVMRLEASGSGNATLPVISEKKDIGLTLTALDEGPGSDSSLDTEDAPLIEHRSAMGDRKSDSVVKPPLPAEG